MRWSEIRLQMPPGQLCAARLLIPILNVTAKTMACFAIQATIAALLGATSDGTLDSVLRYLCFAIRFSNEVSYELREKGRWNVASANAYTT